MFPNAILDLFRRYQLIPVIGGTEGAPEYDLSWRPNEGDRLRLAVGLTVTHNEPGFAFHHEPALEEVATEATWPAPSKPMTNWG